MSGVVTHKTQPLALGHEITDALSRRTITATDEHAISMFGAAPFVRRC
jgi:hypothetical protein